MNTHAVAIVGGGPTGLMLAAELVLGGVDVAVIERRSDQGLGGSRAGGLHARTIEVLDQRGVAGRFLAEGQTMRECGFASIKLDIGDFPTRHPYVLALWQDRVEEILAAWIAELGVPIYRRYAVTGFEQDRSGVSIATAEGAVFRADYVVGCDGGRSAIRKAAGIAFPGTQATASNLIAEVEMTGSPPLGIHRTESGIHSFGKRDYTLRDGQVLFKEGGPVRVMVPEAGTGAKGEPTLDQLKAALVAVCGSDYGAHTPTWISRFTNAARQAAAYRDRRVLLAGDAAHVHSPVGGQGLNTGVQDAVNLGWKLAQVVQGASPECLLDTYHAERHPVGARVLRHAKAASALLRPDDQSGALRETLAELLVLDAPRRQVAADLTGLGIRYDFGGDHPRRAVGLPAVGLVRSQQRAHPARWACRVGRQGGRWWIGRRTGEVVGAGRRVTPGVKPAARSGCWANVRGTRRNRARCGGCPPSTNPAWVACRSARGPARACHRRANPRS